jgi:hypothetical protein
MKTVGSEKLTKWMQAHPLAEVVQALRVSAQSINNWRAGRQIPQFHHRQNIKHLTGTIEPGDWLSTTEILACQPESGPRK